MADARADAESTSVYARRLADEKLSLMAELKHERGEMHQFRCNFSWGLKYLQEKKTEHFAHLNELRERVDGALKVQESKLRKLSIEYDEELYPHLMSTIAECRYVSLILFITIFLDACYLLTRALLPVQVVDQPWSALGCHGHAGVPGSRGGFWESCRMRHGAWQGAGCGGAS